MNFANVIARPLRCAWLGVVLCLFAGLVWGQEKVGGLQGTVSDDTNAVLPGVAVTLTNKVTRRVINATAGPYGNYVFQNVEPGPYSVVFELKGFARTEFPGIDVLMARNLRLDARMKPGAVTTVVQVTDVQPLVDTQNSSVIFHLPQEAFERLPKARSFQQQAILAPRVNVGEVEGGIQVNGASSAENAFLIDGVATNSAIDGRSRQNAVFDYLQEIQIQTAGVEASYAGALGGVISTVTRSGGDELHGNAWFYYTGDFLNSAPPQRLVLSPLDNQTVDYFQDDKNRFRGVEPGFSLGGPIKTDRLYFFTSWSPRWTRQDQPYQFSNGTESGEIRRTQTHISGFNKISWEPDPRARTNFTWLWTPSKSKGSLPVYNGACPNCLSSTMAANAANTERGFFNPQSSYGANADFALRHNIVLSTRANYFWDNYKDSGIPDTTSVQYQTPAPLANGLLAPTSLQGGVGFQNTPAIAKFHHDRVARAAAQLDLSIVGRLAGVHNLKGGYSIDKTVNDVNRAYPGGYVHVWWDRSFTSPATGVSDRGVYGYYEVNDFRTLGSTGARTKALYVQDNWRISERVTLNVGVRWENDQVPSFRRDIQSVAIHFGWGAKFSPRLGAAVDVFGDGKLKAFGSWGRYFDPVRFDLARTVFGGEIWRTYYRSLDTLDVFNLSLNNMPGRDIWNPGVTAFRDRRSAAAGLASVDPNLKPMSQDQWSFGTDYQWNPATAIGVRYVHQTLRRAIEDLAVLRNGNASYIYANPGEGLALSAPFVTGSTVRPLPYPKPVRDYDAVEVTLAKRFADRWFGNFSYTWSRLYGNYSGTANSDELLTPTTGVSHATAQLPGGSIAHPARYANLAWDLDEILFDSKGHLDTRGLLATDRTHVFKWNGGYEFDFNRIGRSSVGAFFYLGSGTPLSTVVHTQNNLPVLVNGRGDLGRTPALSQTDLQFAHVIELAETQDLRFELNVLNAFNQKTARHRFVSANRGAGVAVASSAINLSTTDLRNGYDYNALIQATADGANAFDPRYGKDDLFSEGLSARLGVKWSF
jgi:outer membrane receptor protein involved in Fe transport